MRGLGLAPGPAPPTVDVSCCPLILALKMVGNINIFPHSTTSTYNHHIMYKDTIYDHILTSPSLDRSICNAGVFYKEDMLFLKKCLNIHEYHVSCVISLHLPACLVLQNIKSVRMIKMTRTPIIAPIMGASASSVRATQYGAGREEKSSPENYSDHFLFALSQDYFS